MAHDHTFTFPPADAKHPLRLRLKPKAAPTGHVDGAWWPRTRDLAAELPELAEVLGVRLGAVSRVAYAMSGWDDTPRRVEVDGQVVRLEGFHVQDGDVVHLTGADERRISLLVVPPGLSEAAGHDAMTTASGRGNADSPADILAAVG